MCWKHSSCPSTHTPLLKTDLHGAPKGSLTCLSKADWIRDGHQICSGSDLPSPKWCGDPKPNINSWEVGYKSAPFWGVKPPLVISLMAQGEGESMSKKPHMKEESRSKGNHGGERPHEPRKRRKQGVCERGER